MTAQRCPTIRQTVRYMMMVALTVVAGGVAIACDDTEQPIERIMVTMSGTCAPAELALTIEPQFNGTLKLVAGQDADIPNRGALGQSHLPLRRGEWQLYGDRCLPDRACPGPVPFRRCVARRTSWFLELDCTDGTGAPACQARLRE
jgi:hypothetical protein